MAAVSITAARHWQSRQAIVSQRLEPLLIIDLLVKEKNPLSLVYITVSIIIKKTIK